MSQISDKVAETTFEALLSHGAYCGKTLKTLEDVFEDFEKKIRKDQDTKTTEMCYEALHKIFKKS